MKVAPGRGGLFLFLNYSLCICIYLGSYFSVDFLQFPIIN